MTRREVLRVHASMLETACMHGNVADLADQLELTDRTQRVEQLRLVVPPAVRVTPAIAGDVVTIEHRLSVVRAACEAPATGYYCLPCHQRCANRYQLELHIADGPHVVARECPLHGLETLATLTGECS